MCEIIFFWGFCMGDFDFDLFVIGGGSGGVRAARFAAASGKKVAIAEKQALGGTCVNVGCIPKKLFSYAAHFRNDFEDANGFGWKAGEPSFSWQTLLNNKNQEIERLNLIYEKLLVNSGVQIIEGHASLETKQAVSVEGRTYSAKNILVAVGGKPEIPEFPGHEHVISSDEAFYLKKLPQKVLVVGGGYIAVEFASIFNGLGCETSQLYRGELFLRGFDSDARGFLASQIRESGIDLRFNCSIKEIKKQNEQLVAKLSSGEELSCDLIMYATGRTPLTENLGLEKLGINLDSKKAIKVDENYKTNIDSILAIGDVTNRVNLTPVALAEAMTVVSFLYGDGNKRVDYSLIPSAVFSLPNLATVGLTEEKAREKHQNIKVFVSEFRPLKHTLTGSHEKTFMKLIVDEDNDLVLGAHMVGADAGESLQGIAVAMKAGATKKMFDETIGIHPTTAEEWVTMRDPVKQ